MYRIYRKILDSVQGDFEFLLQKWYILEEFLPILGLISWSLSEPPRGKTNNVVSEQVRHKPACTSTEKSKKLEISDLSRRGIVLSE